MKDWTRFIKNERTINDMIEDIHTMLVEGDKYRGYLWAVWDEQAVEGSLSADNIMAASMIREKALSMDSPIAKEKLATISKSLGVVLRRYHSSRNERRNMVGGEVVGDSNGNARRPRTNDDVPRGNDGD
jgi:putative heme iron utilization protein